MLHLLTVSVALAQTMTYDLTMNGQAIGTRTVSIRYVIKDDGERRILSAYTELKTGSETWTSRTSGQSGPGQAQFNSAVSHNGALSQVQGTLQPGGGWRMFYADPKGVREYTLSSAEARMSTMDLMDPGRTALLATSGGFGVVLVETGTTLTGVISAGAPAMVRVDGEELPVTRYVLTGPTGAARFDIDSNGLLIRSEMSWLGGVVVATLRTLPAARSFGETETIKGMETGIQETPL